MRNATKGVQCAVQAAYVAEALVGLAFPVGRAGQNLLEGSLHIVDARLQVAIRSNVAAEQLGHARAAVGVRIQIQPNRQLWDVSGRVDETTAFDCREEAGPETPTLSSMELLMSDTSSANSEIESCVGFSRCMWSAMKRICG